MEKEILKELTQSIQTRWLTSPKLVWIREVPTDDDLKAIKEAGKESPFDPLLLRATLFKELERGDAKLHCRHLLQQTTGKLLAKVLLILPNNVPVKDALPWNIWMRIFNAMGSPGLSCHSTGPWRVILFGSLARRERPPIKEPLGPAHVNGGYAYPSDPQSIVIYRLEEATRVLLHELLHACGSDNMALSEPEREVRTESWAELYLIAILAKGSVYHANRMWKQQAKWIREQEEILTLLHGVESPEDYAWRYTVGRRMYLEAFGFQFSEPEGPHVFMTIWGNTSRFTYPFLNTRYD